MSQAIADREWAASTSAPFPSPARRGWGADRWRRVALATLVPAGLLGAWQLASALRWFSISQLPPPASVLVAAVELAQRGLLAEYVGISMQRVLIGFAIGASLGLALAAVTGLARQWDALLGSTLGAIRAVPSLAWVPLLVLWLKIGEESKITLIAIGAFFPIYTTVSGALRHVDPQLIEAGRAYGLRATRLFTTVQLPAVLPAVISGLRMALAQSWLFLVAAELIASSAGLGFLLIDSQNNGRVDRILLAILALAILGKASDGLIGLFERWAVRRWT